MQSQTGFDEEGSHVEEIRGNNYGNLYVCDAARVHQGNIYNDYRTARSRSAAEDSDLLLKAFYYESMNSRRAQITGAEDSTCDWIWSTAFARWLRVEKARLFWISGKPGSGKSTLMKFLGKSSQLHQKLPRHEYGWIVVNFFFDFRLGREIGNTVEGLFRSILDQVFRRVPEIASHLGSSVIDYQDLSLENLKVLFVKAIQLAKEKVVLCIDGLDEFSGHARSLLTSLLSLKHHRGIKICLASRPEPMIREMLAGFPNLHMSDHNAEGIQRYIDLSVQQFQPLLDSLQLWDIRKLIHERAEGVFLWVYLALEEILELSASGASNNEIRAQLDVLPKEVEALYQRILDRIPERRKVEASLTYILVASYESIIDLSLLRAAIHFVSSELGVGGLTPPSGGIEHFERRICATMGGLLEVQPGKSSLEVRLIHETVRSFSNDTQWTESFVTSEFNRYFPGDVWIRLRCEVLNAGKSLPLIRIADIMPSTDVGASTSISFSRFSQMIERLTQGEKTEEWIRILYESIKDLPLLLKIVFDGIPSELTKLVTFAMCSRMARMHLPMFEPHLYALTDTFCPDRSASCDLIFAALHAGHQYLQSQQDRIKNLSTLQRNTLVLGALAGSSEFFGQNCTDSLSIMRKMDFLTLSDLRKVANLCFFFNDDLTSLQLAVFVRLGYKAMPRFLLKHLDQVREDHTWLSVQLPAWAHVKGLFPNEPPLFAWPCEYNTGQYEPGVTPESQLQVLLRMGVDINSISSKGYNIVHYIITEHIFQHAFLFENHGCWSADDMAPSIEKLYLVEQAGADFSIEFEYRTPLQALRFGRDKLYRIPEAEREWEIPVHRIAQLEFMLYHKEKMGHLPQPMMGIKYRGRDPQLLTRRRCTRCNEQTSGQSSQRSRSAQDQRDFPTPSGEAVASYGFI